jgi:adenylosuccinate synthase
MQISEKGKAAVVLGGQWGSEAKGAVIGWLAQNKDNVFDLATTNAGAQAGHTAYRLDGEKVICFHLPTTSVINDTPAYLNAGAIIDPEVLEQEIKNTRFEGRLYIHPHAAVIRPIHKQREGDSRSGPTKIASTQKGVGAALADKILRNSDLAFTNTDIGGMADNLFSRMVLNDRLEDGQSIIVEVPQGFDLSINHGYMYPHTTSRDCWVGSGLSDAGIHPKFLGKVVMVVRTYPIRVGNIVVNGNTLGHSGPNHPDQDEITFESLGQGIEYTTVTNRPRRIFTFSSTQYANALRYNRPTHVVLTFCNYCQGPGAYDEIRSKMRTVENQSQIFPQHWMQYGVAPDDFTDSETTLMAKMEWN